MSTVVQDKDWIRQSFLLPKDVFRAVDFQVRAGSTAGLKFADSTPGGNFAINNPPQFSRYTDIRVPGIYQNQFPDIAKDTNFSRGLGRYWSEAIDDNSQLIHMRFGVPQFNSLTQFFGNFYSHTAGTYARTGRGPGIWFTAGKIAGTILSLPFAPLIIAGQVANFFLGTQKSKYYYMKPTMPLYWNAVHTMLNGIAVNMGIIPRAWGDGAQRAADNSDAFTAEDLAYVSQMLPDIVNESGSIDVYALATKAQRLSNAQHKAMLRAAQNFEGSADSLNATTGEKTAALHDMLRQASIDSVVDIKASRGIHDYLKHYASLDFSKPSAANPEGSDFNNDTGVERVDTLVDEPGLWDQFKDYAEAEQDDGADFVTFRVDHSGEASESFTNNVSDSELGQKLNGLSSSARVKRFSFADGNVDGGIVSSVLGSTKEFIAGSLEGIQLSGLMAVAGNGFVDIPKQWESSQVDLPKASYTIELRTPYGNKMSRLIHLYIPLSMLLAGAMPISTGLQSYTSPFLCELFSKGRNQTRLGMIDSLSITRGTGNLGWNQDGDALGIDITFSVVDLSSIMSMPLVSNDGLIGEVTQQIKEQTFGIFDDDNAFTDYLAVLGSLGLADQVYATKKLSLNQTRAMVNFEKWSSPAFYANKLTDLGPVRLFRAFEEGTNRR